jgi:hypothetical protein
VKGSGRDSEEVEDPALEIGEAGGERLDEATVLAEQGVPAALEAGRIEGHLS